MSVNGSTDSDLGIVAQRFAANMRAHRERLGLTQGDLAQMVTDAGFEVTQQTITRIESQRRAVKIEEALAISRALGVSVDALTRPEGLADAAGKILRATRDAREAHREMTRWATALEGARERLGVFTRQAKESHPDELADEIWIGELALKETGSGNPQA